MKTRHNQAWTVFMWFTICFLFSQRTPVKRTLVLPGLPSAWKPTLRRRVAIVTMQIGKSFQELLLKMTVAWWVNMANMAATHTTSIVYWCMSSKWKHSNHTWWRQEMGTFPALLFFSTAIHRLLMDSLAHWVNKSQQYQELMSCLLLAWINFWINGRPRVTGEMRHPYTIVTSSLCTAWALGIADQIPDSLP